MNFVQRKATTAKCRCSPEDFKAAKRSFLADVVATVTMEEIPPELIINWDQTSMKVVPTSSWTMEKEGSQRVEIIGSDDKRVITAVFCGTLQGNFLPVQLTYKGKTKRCHPRFKFPAGWLVSHSHNHWSTETTMIKCVIVPYVENVRGILGDNKPALAIMDNFKGQTTDQVFSLLESHNIHVTLLPPNCTDVLQPMDISVNRPAKAFMK